MGNHQGGGNLKHIRYLRCARCGATHAPAPNLSTCEACHDDIDRPGVLEVVLDPEASRRALLAAVDRPLAHGMWRWQGLLPVPAGEEVTLGEGNTPLLSADRLARAAGFDGQVYVKNETINPTGSFKDRTAAVVVGMARTAGASILTLVSSGNMGAAVAAYASVSGMKVCVIVPPATDPAKVAQMSIYGGTVIRVKGNGSDRLRLMERAVNKLGWYNANSPLNPYGPEGTKTTAYELWVQLGRVVPDWVVLPVGFGCNLVGLWRGFRELRDAGLAQRLPRLAGIQPEGSPSFVRAFQEGRDEASADIQETIAWGISQRVTLNSRLGLRALAETDGAAEKVSDAEMLAAQKLLAGKEGVFAEPSAAAAVAGFHKLVSCGRIAGGESVIIVVTGSGLKQVEAACHAADDGDPIEPDLDLLRRRVRAARSI